MGSPSQSPPLEGPMIMGLFISNVPLSTLPAPTPPSPPRHPSYSVRGTSTFPSREARFRRGRSQLFTGPDPGSYDTPGALFIAKPRPDIKPRPALNLPFDESNATPGPGSYGHIFPNHHHHQQQAGRSHSAAFASLVPKLAPPVTGCGAHSMYDTPSSLSSSQACNFQRTTCHEGTSIHPWPRLPPRPAHERASPGPGSYRLVDATSFPSDMARATRVAMAHRRSLIPASLLNKEEKQEKRRRFVPKSAMDVQRAALLNSSDASPPPGAYEPRIPSYQRAVVSSFRSTLARFGNDKKAFFMPGPADYSPKMTKTPRSPPKHSHAGIFL